MQINPLSFKSLMVFTLEDNKPKAPIPLLMKAAFDNNPKLSSYLLTDVVEFNDDKIDGTVHNASKNFAKRLDVKYKKQLPKDSKKVILTEANFHVNAHETKKRYFLTASTNDKEEELHNILSKSAEYYVAKFGFKK